MKQKIGLLAFLIVSLALVTFFAIPKKPSLEKKTIGTVRLEGAVDAKIAAIKFFQVYDSCIKNNTDKSALEKQSVCVGQNPYIAPESVKDFLMTNQNMIDPILCSSELPSSYQVSTDGDQKDNKAKLMVVETLGLHEQKMSLEIARVDNVWKVQKIACP